MSKNKMKKLQIGKVVVNMGVGSSGEKLIDSEEILKSVTGQEPKRTEAKQTLPNFGIREGEPIGCKVTLRNQKARDFLKKAFKVKNNQIQKKSIDKQGNFSLGIDEHTNFPDQEYDPNVGIFGLDIAVNMKRPGYNVKEKSEKKDIGDSHKITPEETQQYLEETFDVEVVEEDEWRRKKRMQKMW